MKEINVETFLKPMGQGVSRPVLVLGNDFKQYILKNEHINVDGNLTKYDCMFVNELLAYQLGYFLEVPMPEAVIAYIAEDFIKDDPSIRFAYRFENGKYFASQKLENIENNILDNYVTLIEMNKPRIKRSWNNFFKNISNLECIPNIIAFDILIANFDRYNNEGNILVSNDNVRNIYAIDHGHAFFGPVWDDNKIQCLNAATLTQEYINSYNNIIVRNNIGNLSGSGIIFNALEQYINLEDLKNHSFVDVIEKIESISENMIESWLNNIPKEWYINKEFQGIYFKKYILNQKNVVKYIIQNLAQRNAFTNYRGGILEWRNQGIKSHTVL